MSGHLVRCRGGEWRIKLVEAGFSFSRKRSAWGIPVQDRQWRKHFHSLWSGVPRWPADKINPSLSGITPAWLPVAWLCCEADPAEGPKFAAAILDAEPGDDAPALIAAEWLEELGMEGHAYQPISELPEGWAEPRTMFPSARESRFCTGPLASWCRHLIDTRCVACGGRRDGEDLLEAAQRSASFYDWGHEAARKYDRAVGLSAKDCPLCGFPAHPTPPALAIPEVVR